MAKQLHLSTATVARTLAGLPNVSRATQQRVRNLAGTLSFQVNTLAAGLRRGRTGVIGVIVPHLTGHFFPEVLHSPQVLHSITTAAGQARLRVDQLRVERRRAARATAPVPTSSSAS